LPSGFPTKILSTFLNYRTPATCPVHLNPCLSYEKDIRFEYKPFSGTFPWPVSPDLNFLRLACELSLFALTFLIIWVTY
jgi:hypothetical protein